MTGLAADLRVAFWRVCSTPLISSVAVLIIALGVGSSVVMTDMLDRLLLRAPAHVTDADRVARVYVGSRDGSYFDRTGYSTFTVLTAVDDALEAKAVYFTESISLGRGQHARQVEAVAHTDDYFSVLGVRPAVGAWPDGSDPTHENAAVISHALWRQEFGGTDDVLGKSLQLAMHTYTIAAVAPRGFTGIGFKPADVWVSLAPRARFAYGEQWTSTAVFLQVIARLKHGVRRELINERVTAAYRTAHAQSWEKNNVLVFGDLRAARGPQARPMARVEVLVAGMSLLVFLLTCGNVANLLLVRGLRRDREFAIKTVLGATRSRLLREVVLEAAVLATAAGVVAIGLVAAGGSLMRREFLSPVAALASSMDPRLMLVTVAFSVSAVFLLGLAPAVRLSRPRTINPARFANARPTALVDIFSGVQVALSLPLVIAAVLFVVSLGNAANQDFGMRTDRVVIVTTNLFEVGRPMENHAVHRQIQSRLSRLRGVESTAVVQNLPMESSMTFVIDVPDRDDLWRGTVSSDVLPSMNPVDPSYFELMGMRLLDGRLFREDENRKGAPSVAIITESMAEVVWPGKRAVGRCFYMSGRSNPCTEVVGVLADARLSPSIRPTKEWASAYYVPIEQSSGASSRALLVRTAGNPGALLHTLRSEAQVAVPNLPYVNAREFDDVFRSMLKPWRLGSVVFGMFGAVSILVTGLGLAVVSAYAVTRRIKELRIRSALGATPRQLVRLVLRRSLGIIVSGLAVGLFLAWTAATVMSAQLFGIAGTDSRVFIGASLVLLLVGCFAAWMPASQVGRLSLTPTLTSE